MTADANVEHLQAQVSKWQRKHEHIGKVALGHAEKCIRQQHEIDRLERKLMGIYKLAAVDCERPFGERLNVVAAIVEEAIPRRVCAFRERRGLPELNPPPP